MLHYWILCAIEYDDWAHYLFVFDWHDLFALNCRIVGAPIQVRKTCRDTVKIGVNTVYRPEKFLGQ